MAVPDEDIETEEGLAGLLLLLALGADPTTALAVSELAPELAAAASPKARIVLGPARRGAGYDQRIVDALLKRKMAR